MEVKKYSSVYPDLESVKTHELCANIIPFNFKRNSFSDITGALPYKSSRGNLYVMVMYDNGRNAILSEPINNRQTATICDAFFKIHKVLKARGSKPKVYMMENECSSDLKEAMEKV